MAGFSKKNFIEHKTCDLILSATFIWNISRSKKKWARYDQKYVGLHIKHPLLLSNFNDTWFISTDFRKIIICLISWKSVQREPSCSVLTDGRTDLTKLIAAFRNFVKARKKIAWLRRPPSFLCVYRWFPLFRILSQIFFFFFLRNLVWKLCSIGYSISYVIFSTFTNSNMAELRIFKTREH